MLGGARPSIRITSSSSVAVAVVAVVVEVDETPGLLCRGEALTSQVEVVVVDDTPFRSCPLISERPG